MIVTQGHAEEHAKHHMNKASHIAVLPDGQIYLCKSSEELTKISESNETVFIVKGSVATKEKKSKTKKESE